MKRLCVRPWARVLVVGLALFALAVIALSVTGNVHLVPSVLLLGALLVPVTFAIFLYGLLREAVVPRSMLAAVAVAGGLLGLTLAGLFEYATLTSLGVLPLLAIALIEETVKLVGPGVALLRRAVDERSALLLGVASGLGFAVFETLGYGFAELLRTDGDIGSVLHLLLLRGVLSPAGHAAWTGLLTVALWRLLQPGASRWQEGSRFGVTLGLVVGLHVAWNFFAAMPLYVLVVLASLAFFRARLREIRVTRPPAKRSMAGASYRSGPLDGHPSPARQPGVAGSMLDAAGPAVSPGTSSEPAVLSHDDELSRR